ncbi:hypothetical protein LS68_009495 [Helicobacter sp. MIT 05-5293]|uniref:hypothetical protein n=1 Tax=Helicobacter sp. MIT 05-5293 TaxID=1548149 RepID=UPI00051DD3F2|nr:hypothetical protein [Helicobacter sp. MIT 05-5293]TLD79817.1 hypothetical protein LS68_009495 [Helicobacter sp. MIT 05-5293]
MKKLGFIVAICLIGFGGCAQTQPSNETLDQQVEKKLREYTQPAVDKLYSKVLSTEEAESLNACVAKNFTSKLTQEEKLFLAGSAAEKVQYKDAASTIAQKAKPTSTQMKEVTKYCVTELGIKKVASKIAN